MFAGPFSRKKLQMVELLYSMAIFDPNFLSFIAKEAWALMLDDLFEHIHNSIY